MRTSKLETVKTVILMSKSSGFPKVPWKCWSSEVHTTCHLGLPVPTTFSPRVYIYNISCYFWRFIDAIQFLNFVFEFSINQLLISSFSPKWLAQKKLLKLLLSSYCHLWQCS